VEDDQRDTGLKKRLGQVERNLDQGVLALLDEVDDGNSEEPAGYQDERIGEKEPADEGELAEGVAACVSPERRKAEARTFDSPGSERRPPRPAVGPMPIPAQGVGPPRDRA
jgi:hypothetical protein